MKELLMADSAKKARTFKDPESAQVPYLDTPVKASMVKKAFDMQLLVPDPVGVQTASRMQFTRTHLDL